jgi:uncharacterized membrane protein
MTSVANVLSTPEDADGMRAVEPSRVFHPVGQSYWFNPNGINNKGTIIGFFEAAPDATDTGFVLTSAGAFAAFNAPGAIYNYPTGINDDGDTVGYACPDNGSCGPFLRRANGSFSQIPAVIPAGADYAGINNSGVIVGNAPSGSSLYPGFFVSGGEVFQLAGFGENVGFLAINNAGEILGINSDGYFIAKPSN